jgi:hypothetical protein
MKVGGRKLLINQNLLIPEGETAEFDMSITEADVMPIKIIFEKNEISTEGKDTAGPQFELRGGTNEFIMSFQNWESTSFGGTVGPILVAVSDAGEEILMLAAITPLPKIMSLNFQLLLGGPYNGTTA